jgi:hypothetical protein
VAVSRASMSSNIPRFESAISFMLIDLGSDESNVTRLVLAV